MPLNSRQTKYAERIEALIKEGEQLCRESGRYLSPQYQQDLQAWLVKSDNVLLVTFGAKSVQITYFRGLVRFGTRISETPLSLIMRSELCMLHSMT
jgi:hypothetical protein